MEQTADTAYISVPGFVSILKEFLERKCEGKSTGREKRIFFMEDASKL